MRTYTSKEIDQMIENIRQESIIKAGHTYYRAHMIGVLHAIIDNLLTGKVTESFIDKHINGTYLNETKNSYGNNETDSINAG